MANALPRRLDDLRRSFWLLPAVAMAVGLVLAYALVELDYALDLNPWVFNFVDLESGRAVLQTIATVTVSVAGVSFSVTVVALQLASQQLSPRVLRTFQGDRMAQSVLAAFVGTFVYALVVLAQLRVAGVPALAISVGILSAIGSFILFVAFIHHIVDSLKASTVIKRISLDGRLVTQERWPHGVGRPPDDEHAAATAVAVRRSGHALPVYSDRPGFVTDVDGSSLIEFAESHDLLVTQEMRIGDFALTGSLLATVWDAGEDADEHAANLCEPVREAFGLADERSVVGDVGYPVRQLADVALRGLSPSLNDPTTAENAVDSICELLVEVMHGERPHPIRVDDDGVPRLVAAIAELDQLVRLGFEQVRVAAAAHTVLARHLIGRLHELRLVAQERGFDVSVLREQARLISEATLGEVPNPQDGIAVRDQFDRTEKGIGARRHRPDQPDGSSTQK